MEINGKEILPISKSRWEALKHCYMEYYMGELDAGLRSRIIAFNQENSRYRITVRQYVTYNEEMPLQSYIEKGLLTDVGKLLEEDAELDRGQLRFV